MSESNSKNTSNDPVEEAGRKIANTYKLLEQAERIGLDAFQINEVLIKGRADSAYQHLHDDLSALQDGAAALKANSLSGAIVHIMLALEAAWRLHTTAEEAVRDAGDKGCEQWKIDREFRRIMRCIYSAVEAIEVTSGINRDDLGGELLMSRRLNPYDLATETSIENLTNEVARAA